MAGNFEHERTAGEVQMEIEQTRDELDNTLGEIRKRLSPQEIKERATGYVKESASDVVQTMQRNPTYIVLGVALIAATVFARRRAQMRHAREQGDAIRALWEHVTDAVGSLPNGAPHRGAVSDATAKFGELAADAYEGLGQMLAEAASRTQRFANSDPIALRASAVVQPAKQMVATIERASRERPLLALGVAMLAKGLLTSLVRR